MHVRHVGHWMLHSRVNDGWWLKFNDCLVLQRLLGVAWEIICRHWLVSYSTDGWIIDWDSIVSFSQDDTARPGQGARPAGAAPAARTWFCWVLRWMPKSWILDLSCLKYLLQFRDDFACDYVSGIASRTCLISILCLGVFVFRPRHQINLLVPNLTSFVSIICCGVLADWIILYWPLFP